MAENTGTTDINDLIAQAAQQVGASGTSEASGGAPAGAGAPSGVRIQRQTARSVEGRSKSGK